MDVVYARLAQAAGISTVLRDPTPLIAATLNAANAYPLEDGNATSFSHSYLADADPAFRDAVVRQKKQVVELLRALVEKVEPGSGKAVTRSLAESANGPATIADPSKLNLDAFTDFLDHLKEAAETSIDDAKGLTANKQLAVLQTGDASSGGARSSSSARHAQTAVTTTPRQRGFPKAANIAKPQSQFEDQLDNSRERPFAPKLQVRYHALTEAEAAAAGKVRAAADGPWRIAAPVLQAAESHPYRVEITSLAYESWQLERVTPARFTALDDVQVNFADGHSGSGLIDTPAGLEQLMDYLEGTGAYADEASGQAEGAKCWRVSDLVGRHPVREIALDLEAHSLRSFQGFTCLMQLSTREQDFLVDTLALRSHLHVLNRITCDPRVLKVLHGCDSDILWMQRDFGVYMVNVFDTGQAAKLLAYPSFGLAHLLQRFAGVVANKAFQTADWRVRPLPAEMLKYAREDTHYLLGIYDRVKNELIDSSADKAQLAVRDTGATPVPFLLVSCLFRSIEKCLGVYMKEPWSATAFRRAMAKLGYAGAATGAPAPVVQEGMDEDETIALTGEGSNALMSGTASAVPESPRTRAFAALFDWRDAVARVEDESPYHVLPPRALARIADSRPTSVADLTKVCAPMTDSIRSRLQEVLAVLKAAGEGRPAPMPVGFEDMERGTPAIASSSSRVGQASTSHAGAGAKRTVEQAGLAVRKDVLPTNSHARVPHAMFFAPVSAPPGGWLCAPPKAGHMHPPYTHTAACARVRVTMKEHADFPLQEHESGSSSNSVDVTKRRRVFVGASSAHVLLASSMHDLFVSETQLHHAGIPGMTVEQDAEYALAVRNSIVQELKHVDVQVLLGLRPVSVGGQGADETGQIIATDIPCMGNGSDKSADAQGIAMAEHDGTGRKEATPTPSATELLAQAVGAGHGSDGLPLSIMQRFPSAAGVKKSQKARTGAADAGNDEAMTDTAPASMEAAAAAAGLVVHAPGQAALEATTAFKAEQARDAKRAAKAGKGRHNPYKRK